MTKQTVTFTDFVAGEYGTLGSWSVGFRLFRQHLLYRGYFTGTNVLRTIDGTLCPRFGCQLVNITGVPTGKVLGFLYNGIPGKTGLIIIGTSVYDFDFNAGAGSAMSSAYTGALGATATVPVAMVKAANGLVYATISGDKTYKIDMNARTVTALTGSPGGTCIAIYGNRLVVGNINPDGQRLRFSGDNSALPTSAGDFTKWDALNYIDIGDTWPINFLGAQRTHLAIGKQNSWWVLTGTLGTNEVVRPANHLGPWVQTPRAASVVGDGGIYFVDFYNDIVASFDGARIGQLPHLAWNGGNYSEATLPPPFSVCGNKYADEVAYAGVTTPGTSARLAWRHAGVWTFHTLNPSGHFQGAWMDYDGLGNLYFCDGGATGVAAKFYMMPSWHDRPPIYPEPMADGTIDVAATPPPASFTLPEWWERDGSEVQVRSVYVDIERFNHGYNAHNHFDITVTPMRRYGNGPASGGLDGSPSTWNNGATALTYDEPASAAGSAGQSSRLRLQFNVNSQSGNGFRLALANLVGCKVQKIDVIVEGTGLRGN